MPSHIRNLEKDMGQYKIFTKINGNKTPYEIEIKDDTDSNSKLRTCQTLLSCTAQEIRDWASPTVQERMTTRVVVMDNR